ncbi:MAG: hypothetical protein H6621_12560 [Halobacteriovoraceae bacterium]|nr:hypothetical protein [Halobacteriovoraceae bacterium]
MIRWLLLGFIVLNANALYAIDQIIMKDTDVLEEKIYKKHWYFTLDTTLIMYNNPLSYTGSKNTFKSKEHLPYIGPTLAIGYAFPLSSSFWTSTQISGFFYQNKEREIERAKEEYPLSIRDSIVDNKMYGLFISQTFTIRMKMGSYFFEPFAQIGIGYALANNKLKYTYDDLVNMEEYYVRVDEELAFQNVALGFNILSKNGIYLFTKIQKNLITIGKYEKYGSERAYGDSTFLGTANPIVPVNESDNFTKNRDEFSASLGFGYIY